MALDISFVAGVLEGIEGTLDEVIERVDNVELRASLDVLQSRVTALRVSVDPGQHETESVEQAEPVAAGTL